MWKGVVCVLFSSPFVLLLCSCCYSPFIGLILSLSVSTRFYNCYYRFYCSCCCFISCSTSLVIVFCTLYFILLLCPFFCGSSLYPWVWSCFFFCVCVLTTCFQCYVVLVYSLFLVSISLVFSLILVCFLILCS